MEAQLHKAPEVTVAICTYQRPALLARCLDSLQNQQVSSGSYEVLVVDNGGQEEVRELTQNYGYRYVSEAAVGLSSARNRACKETNREWIFFLDDDGIAHPDLLTSFFELVTDNQMMEVVGGRFEHYFESPPPKWLRRYYQDDVRPAAGKGLVLLQNDQYLLGGIMAFKTDLVRKVGGFRTDLGMRGLENGYGEENEFQDRLRAIETTIYYSPSLAMKHLVHHRKLSIKGQIEMAYAHGRDQAKANATFTNSPWLLINEFLRVYCISLPFELLRVIFKPGYYWQNGVVSIKSKMAFARGKYGSIHS